MKLRKGNTSKVWGLFLSDWPHSSTPPLFTSVVWMMSTAPHRGDDDSNGGETRGWENIGQWVSGPGLPMSWLFPVQPRSILQLRVSFTNRHLSPRGFLKSSTNVEGRAKCAQSCQAWPRSNRKVLAVPHAWHHECQNAGAPGCAVWQTCLHLIENAVWMACQNRGDPKWGVPA